MSGPAAARHYPPERLWRRINSADQRNNTSQGKGMCSRGEGAVVLMISWIFRELILAQPLAPESSAVHDTGCVATHCSGR